MKTLIAVFVAGLVLGGTATGLAASTHHAGMYPGDTAGLSGLDLFCSYEPAGAGVSKRFTCGRPSAFSNGTNVSITARRVYVLSCRGFDRFKDGSCTTLYQHARTP
jgi:hypothetical protein